MGSKDSEMKRVYILARKILKVNTRIFKQAKSLTDAGYEVTVIGVWQKGLPFEELKDGYKIIRLELYPMHSKLLRYVRQGSLNIGRATLSIIKCITNWVTLKPLRRIISSTLSKVRELFMSSDLSIGHWAEGRIGHFKKVIFERIKTVMESFQSSKSLKWLLLPLQSLQYIVRSIRLVYRLIRRSKNRFQNYVYRVLQILIKISKKIFNLLYGNLRQLLLFFRWPLISIEYYSMVYNFVKKRLPPPDIVHSNDLDTLFVAYRLSRYYKSKLLYDAQELYTGQHTLPEWYKRLLSIQEWFLIRRADKVTVVNDAIADVMEKQYRIKVDRVILNCPPFEKDFRSKNGSSIRDRFGIDEKEPVYLYSGGLVEQRGIENTVLSLKYLKDGVLVILGEGQIKDSLVEMISSEGLEKRVFFSDFVLHTEVPTFISSADVGIIPYENVGINHYLCSPSKLFHYIMAELPVVCSDFPFLRKVVLDNELGATFDPANPESIARAIRSVVESNARYKEIKENLKRAKRIYNWENEEKKFLEIYSNLNGSFKEKLNIRDYKVQTG